MKYKSYILKFKGDPAIVAFLGSNVKANHDSLGDARRLGRAARTLFGVEFDVVSVTRPKPSAERVKAI